ncbi:MAG TPA: DUF4388 domain-containing protein [Ktedonobacteraceae bacterium]|jgi:hypothetical protein|nr:DUF4388 domain-containing protein [Ktedonobacteraceae bacterium]
MTTNSRLQGLLRDFSLVEVLQMMEFGSMTGAIHLKQQATERIGILYFKDGKIAGCSELDSGALTLGDVLQQLGMATRQDIDSAFSRQMQDAFGKRIGERLVEMRVISNQQLKEALRTKALWTARELARWKEGTYEFVASPVGQSKSILPYGEESLDLEVMGVTMEMVRYTDEWEILERYLPQGMHTALQLAPAIPYPTIFDTRTIELLGAVNRHRVVRRIASSLRRPELEVARDLAQLIQYRLIMNVFQEGPYPRANGNGRGSSPVRLPDPAERLRMESFELLNLLSRMEQEWLNRETPEKQLPALAEFANWTMDALAETCRANGTELDPNTLYNLLARNDLHHMGNYYFRIENNHIDVNNFASLCQEVLHGDIVKANDFFEEASIVLQRILLCIFDTINGRIASLYERLENQEVWEAMFTQFGLPRG